MSKVEHKEKAKAEKTAKPSQVKDGKLPCLKCDKMLPLESFPTDNSCESRAKKWRFCRECESKRKAAQRSKKVVKKNGKKPRADME